MLRSSALPAALLVAALAAPSAAQPPDAGYDQSFTRFRYQPCRDAGLAPLIGRPVVEATRMLRDLGLQRFRLLAHTTVVFADEIVPGRATLVASDGRIVRAFCR